MNTTKPKSPEEILQRLEELKKWQEEQQHLLIQRQKSQRQLLEEEQRLMYEKHGFANPNDTAQYTMEESFEKSCEISTEQVEAPKTLNGLGADRKSTAEESRSNGGVASVKQVAPRPFLKKGEGLTSRFNVDPEKFRLNNLPRYKYAKRVTRPPDKLPKKFTSAAPFATQTGSSSTLAGKYESSDSGRGKSVQSLSEFSVKCAQHTSQGTLPPEQDSLRQSNEANTLHNSSLATTDASGAPISWADVLNPNNIKPFSMDNLQKLMDSRSTENSCREDDELDNLSLFELLEKKAQEGSILVDTSILQRWIRNIQCPGKETDNESSVDISSLLMKRMSPLPCDINPPIQIDESDASSSVTNEEEDDDSARNAKNTKCRVRFSEDVEVNEIHSESDAETVTSVEESFMDSSKTSTPNSKLTKPTTNWKPTLEDTSSTTEFSTTLTEDSTLSTQQSELLEKTELLKSRLVELEKEIAEFQRHNSDLIRLKQECEMEKVRCDQERQELGERLKDDRIKLEIQIHDERMQLEEEKKKYEKLMKDQRSKSRRESEEIVKLREQVERLQKENRDKESKHSAAQARMRTQVRNLEKDLKEFSVEVDVLRKEKKRLEGENARLVRNNNNKMLQEINKSIAKLVPKATPDLTEVKHKNPKPVIAKVTSHTSDPSHRQSIRSIQNRSRSSLSKPANKSETADSSDDSSDTLDENQSAYFKRSVNAQPAIESRDPSESDDRSVDNENNISTMEVAETKTDDEFKREIMNPDGSKDIWYTNGNLKKISADGMVIRMLYYNKDIKETNINEGTVKYYYAETNTWHTTYLDGLEILEYPNGQTEHRFKDGTIEMHFENGSIRINNPADPTKLEEWRYPDGTKLVKLKTGDKIILFPNGQKEVHTKVHKRREFPDGTVKILYPDGSQETRYSNGRVRLKDKDGNLIMDSVQT